MTCSRASVRDQKGRKQRHVGERLVEMHDQLLEQLVQIRRDRPLAVVGLEQRRHLARVGQLVVGAVVEADAEAVHRLHRRLAHERDDACSSRCRRRERRPSGTSAIIWPTVARCSAARSASAASSRSNAADVPPPHPNTVEPTLRRRETSGSARAGVCECPSEWFAAR